MAGHSKWANIQHRKKAQDAKRGKVFTRLIREIGVAARAGGADPAGNPRLRLAVDKALSANMPRDNIDRAIKKATGDLDGVNYEQVRYEGYGPGGVAVMVDALTDNRNRTVAEVRHALSKYGGNLGTDGSVAFLFTRRGMIAYGPDTDEERLMEAALEAGAEDVVTHDDGAMDVLTAPDEFIDVRDALIDAGLQPEDAELTEHPASTTALDVDAAQRFIRLIERLEELDDVQNVYANAELPAEAYEA